MDNVTGPLDQIRRRLLSPFAETQRRLLCYLNLTYLILAPTFLIFEKLATGHFVPHPVLGAVYVLVGLSNTISFFYNLLVLRNRNYLNRKVKHPWFRENSVLDKACRWTSIVSILLLAALNMVGFGNPANDSIFNDFAFGNSLIVLVAILLGRKTAAVWFLVVMGILFFLTFARLGYDYRYNYLTKSESRGYEQALAEGQPWAVERSRQLTEEGLMPPKASRYFHTWLIFCLIAFFTAYFFTGISHEIIRMIPEATQDVIQATEAYKAVQQKNHILKEQALRVELEFLRTQLNPHFLFNTLHMIYADCLEHSEELASMVLKVADMMRYNINIGSAPIPLEDEIKYLKDYISLAELRFRRLSVDFSTTGETEGKMILPFALITLIENAFKHGITNDDACPLVFRIETTPSSIHVFTSNRKNNRPPVGSTRFGLLNLQQRLRLAYGPDHVFEISQDETMFACHLVVNVTSPQA